jgi:DNA invertase Pin-like site-specific DNA recombinase
MKPAVAYLRVSTKQQGQSGLGLDAQRVTVRGFIEQNGYRLVNGREYVEIESGSKDNRPELQRALAACRAHGAALLVARLDRLSRNATFLLTLHDAGVDVRACDMPELDRFMLGVLALVAEKERDLISRRTKDALACAKARGVVLGGYRGGYVSDYARERSAAVRAFKARQKAADAVAQVEGWERLSPAKLARALNALGVPTASGRGAWDETKAWRAKRLVATA